MIRRFAFVFVLTVSFITMAISYGDYEEQMRNYYDSLYQRSYVKKQQSRDESSEIVKLEMPGVHPETNDTYLCTAVDLQNRKAYIAGFQPHAEMHTAHHMLLFGCPMPAENSLSSDGKFWNCGEMGSGVCRGPGEKILYAWGRNAPMLRLPPDVAFEVGGNSGVGYLVLQVHYGKVDNFVANPTLKDYSGVDLHTTAVEPRYKAAIKVLADGWSLIPPKKQEPTISLPIWDTNILQKVKDPAIQPSRLAAIFLLASDGDIPKHKRAWHLDTGYQYRNGPVLHPFAFRVHAHSIGRVITGYRIRNGQWTLIGKGDPQRPQAFYPINEDIKIESGDSMAARCTFNSMKRDRITYIGATMKDEMCNFYMMYWYDPKQNDMGASSIEDSWVMLNENDLHYPADSDVPLPDNGPKMEMKRNLGESQLR